MSSDLVQPPDLTLDFLAAWTTRRRRNALGVSIVLGLLAVSGAWLFSRLVLASAPVRVRVPRVVDLSLASFDMEPSAPRAVRAFETRSNPLPRDVAVDEVPPLVPVSPLPEAPLRASDAGPAAPLHGPIPDGTGSDGGRKESRSGAVGSGSPASVLPPRFDAAYLKNPSPEYPEQSRRLKEEGRVVLRILVSTEGEALDVELRASSGSSRLDQAALKTVRRWRFQPARLGQESVTAWVLVPIVFSLDA